MPVFLFGRSPKWECERCGETYRSNPQECNNCEYTVFKKYTDDSTSSSSGSSRFSHGGPWACSRCGYRHDRKPFTCDNCGGNAIRKAPRRNVETADTNSSYGDVKTIHTTAPPPGEIRSSKPSYIGGFIWLLVLLTSAFFLYNVFL